MQSTVWKLTSLTLVVAVGLICIFQAQKHFPGAATKAASSCPTNDAEAVAADEVPEEPVSSPTELPRPRKLSGIAEKKTGKASEPAPIKDVLADENPFADEQPKKIVPSSQQKQVKTSAREGLNEDAVSEIQKEKEDAGPALIPTDDPPATPKAKKEKKNEETSSKPVADSEEATVNEGAAYNPFDEKAAKAQKKSEGTAEGTPPENVEAVKDTKEVVADDADFPEAVAPEKLLTKKRADAKTGPDLNPVASTPEKSNIEESVSGPSAPAREGLAEEKATLGESEPQRQTAEQEAPVKISPESPRVPEQLPKGPGGKSSAVAEMIPAKLPGTAEEPARKTPQVAAPAGKGREKAKRPQLTIEKQAPETATLGQKMVYTILVKNVSDLPAHQVVVQDEIPAGLELDGTIPRAELSGQKLIWRIGLLGPGEERLIKARVTPTQEGDLGSVATVNFLAEPPKAPIITSGQAIRTPNVPQSVLELDVDQPREVQKGVPFQIKFKITNVGKVRVENIMLRGILHPLMKHQQISERELDCPIENLNPGQSFSVPLDLVGLNAGISVNRIQLLVNQQRVRESELEIRVGAAK